MRKIGFDIRLQLEAAGFYPRGGGHVVASVQPISRLSPLCLTSRGALKRIRGVSAVANLNDSIAERQRVQAIKRLKDVSGAIEIPIIRLPSPSKGSLLLLLAEFENSQCCFYGLGALGKPAERVADEAADEFLGFLATDGVIDPYLADQSYIAFSSSHRRVRNQDFEGDAASHNECRNHQNVSSRQH